MRDEIFLMNVHRLSIIKISIEIISYCLNISNLKIVIYCFSRLSKCNNILTKTSGHRYITQPQSALKGRHPLPMVAGHHEIDENHLPSPERA